MKTSNWDQARAAGLVAVFFCIFLLFAFAIRSIRYPNECRSSAGTAQIKDNQQPAETLGCPGDWAPTTWFTAALVFVGGLQGILFWWQLGLIKAGLADTSKAAVAAEKAALAAQQTVDTMEAAERTQLRAYVGIKSISIVSPNLETENYVMPVTRPGALWEDSILLDIKNFGQTPARNVTTQVNWHPMKFPFNLPDEFTFPDNRSNQSPDVDDSPSRYYIDKEQIIVSNVTIRDLNCFRASHKREANTFVYGHITYADVYDRRWRRHFCYLYEPWAPAGRSKFPEYKTHNYEERLAETEEPSTTAHGLTTRPTPPVWEVERPSDA